MRLPAFVETFLYKTNKVLGIEICFLDNKQELNCCICEKKGNKVSVTYSKTNLSSLEDISTALPLKGLPVAIVFNGKSIIHKKVGTGEQETVSTAFQKVFPTGNEKEFYTQLYKGLSGQGYASVIRKDKADEWVEKIEAMGYKVIDFFIGPFAIENALALQGARSSVYTYEWAQHRIETEDGKIKEYQFKPEMNEDATMDLGEFSVGSAVLNSFCGALHYFVPVATLIHSNDSVITKYDEYRNSRAFTRLLRTSVVTILAVCVVNFLIFSDYFDKQKKLDNELVIYESAITTHEKLSKDLQNKKQFLERSGLALSSKTSYFTDRLLYDLPIDLNVTYLSVFPLKGRIEKDSVIEFDNKKMVVKGLCNKSIVLNNWINLLKTKEFILDVVLDNFEQESEKESGKFNLTLKLK